MKEIRRLPSEGKLEKSLGKRFGMREMVFGRVIWCGQIEKDRKNENRITKKEFIDPQ